MAKIPAMWSKIVLVLLWVFQTIATVILIILEAWGLAVVTSTSRRLNSEYRTEVREGPGPYDIILLVFCSVSIILNVVEIVMYKKKSLKPSAYLASNVVKTSMWTILLIFTIISAAITTRDLAANYVLVGIIIVVYLLFLSGLIYASIQYNKWRKGRLDQYRSPASGLESQSLGGPSMSYRSHFADNDNIHESSTGAGTSSSNRGGGNSSSD